MKRKNLAKKIRTLEARLQKGSKKLAKLKHKLQAAGNRGKRKSAARDGASRQSKPNRKKKSKANAPAKASSTKTRSDSRKKKRKLNLSPERRAQLAAAMKARWAAKRAAAPDGQDFTLGQAPSP
jgi:hypothetical protein